MTVLAEDNTFKIVFVTFGDVPCHGLEIIPRTCTRQFPVECPVRIGRGNMNTGCYHERGKAREIWERVDFGAASETNRGTSQQKKWHVAAEGGGQLHQLLHPQRFFEQYRQREQYRSRIAGTATQTAAERDPLFQNEPNPTGLARCGKNAICRFYNNIAGNTQV